MDNPVILWANKSYQERDIILQLLEKSTYPTFKEEIYRLGNWYDKPKEEIFDIFMKGVFSIIVSCSDEFYTQYRKIYGLKDRNEGF